MEIKTDTHRGEREKKSGMKEGCFFYQGRGRHMYECVCVYVCVCEREREIEGGGVVTKLCSNRGLLWGLSGVFFLLALVESS